MDCVVAKGYLTANVDAQDGHRSAQRSASGRSGNELTPKAREKLGLRGAL